MGNEVWDIIGTFLNGLRCGNVKRKSYIQLQEVVETKNQKKDAEKKFLIIKNALDSEQKEVVRDYIEALESYAFASENQAYCQGYADCIQLLAGLGILKEAPDIRELIKKIKG